MGRNGGQHAPPGHHFHGGDGAQQMDPLKRLLLGQQASQSNLPPVPLQKAMTLEDLENQH